MLGYTDETKIVLIYGNISYAKGVDLFLQSLKKVNSAFHALIVGQGYLLEELCHDLTNCSSINNVAIKRVNQYVTSYQENIYFSAADVVIFPYRKGYASNSGVLQLAIGYGKAILASDQYVLGELTKKYDLGLCFEPENIDDMAKKIQMVMNMPEEWFEQKRKNCEKAIEDFSIEKIAGQYQKLFEKLAQQH